MFADGVLKSGLLSQNIKYIKITDMAFSDSYSEQKAKLSVAAFLSHFASPFGKIVPLSMHLYFRVREHSSFVW